MPVTAPLNKGNYHTTIRRKSNVHLHYQKAWYLVPRIEIIDGRAEIAYEEVETWFPESWEVKNVNANFIKKNEVTYKMSIPEAKLIEYAFENGCIKEEPKND